MKKLFIFCFALLTSFQLSATHIMGGEITWKCIKSGPDEGKYIFSLKVYRDCDGAALLASTQQLDVWNHPTVTTLSLPFDTASDISPDCDVANSGNGALDCITNPVGAVEEFIYTSLPVVNRNGVLTCTDCAMCF